MSELEGRLQAALGDAYRIERELSGGGMSRLFLAEESSLHRKVVIKLLPPQFASEVSVARFRQEIEVAANLQHPNILPVLAAGARDNLLYYVIPYVPGESLRHRLTREARLPVDDAVQIMREMADALAYAHGQGILHRDIKPENILLEGSHAVLTDFGVARALAEAQGSERLTETGLAVGTPGYMAPEQAAGERHIDARADVYALAVVGYEMLAGKAPFEGPTAQAVLAAHLTETPKSLAAVRPEVPRTVSDTIARALAKNRKERLQTAAEFRDALRPVATASPLLRRRRVVGGAGAIAVVIALGVWRLFAGRSAAPLDADLVAVAPFDVLAPHLDLWREGLVDIVSRNLDGAGPIRTISPTTVIRRWGGRADPGAATELGRSTGAGLVVFGRVVGAGGDSVRLTATLLDAGTGSVVSEFEVRDVADRLDRVADSLTVGLLRELGRTRPIGAVRLASLGSTSLPAIKLFLRAEQYYRRGQWDSTLSYAQRAVAIDSNFTLALRRIPTSLWWRGVSPDVTQLLLREGAKNHGLAPRESLLVTFDSLWGAAAGDAYSWPLLSRMSSTLAEATRRYPDDPEVWYSLGELSFHYSTWVSPRVPKRGAFDAFARSIALDSAFAPAYEHIVDLALGLQEPELAGKYAEAYLRIGPDASSAAALRTALDLLSPQRASTPELARTLDTLDARALYDTWSFIASAADSSEVAVRAARAFSAARPSDQRDRIRQSWVLAQTLAYRGHIGEAARELFTRRPWVGVAANVTVTEVMLSGSLPADSAEQWLAELMKSDQTWAAWGGLTWWASRSDTAALRRLERVARINADSTSPGTFSKAYWRYMVAAVPAYLALSRGDTATTLRLLAALPDSLCRVCSFPRLTRVHLLSARKEDREASGLLDEPIYDAVFNMPSEVLWALERGRVNERLGNRAKAAESYSFVVAVWRNADPALQPYVKEAKEALARLSTEPRR
jgi:serine/threonine-protein kinase